MQLIDYLKTLPSEFAECPKHGQSKAISICEHVKTMDGPFILSGDFFLCTSCFEGEAEGAFEICNKCLCEILTEYFIYKTIN